MSERLEPDRAATRYTIGMVLERRGKEALDLNAADCMIRNPTVIAPDQFAASALAIMEQKKITSLPVVDASGHLEGIIHLHDLWGTEMV